MLGGETGFAPCANAQAPLTLLLVVSGAIASASYYPLPDRVSEAHAQQEPVEPRIRVRTRNEVSLPCCSRERFALPKIGTPCVSTLTGDPNHCLVSPSFFLFLQLFGNLALSLPVSKLLLWHQNGTNVAPRTVSNCVL